MIRAFRRWRLQFEIDRLLADMSVVAEGMQQARAKIEAGEDWTNGPNGAIARLRKMRAELALLTPASEMIDDVVRRKEPRPLGKWQA